MFCSKCGHEVDADAKFCKFCGAEVNVETEVKAEIVAPKEVESNVIAQKPKKAHKWLIAVAVVLFAVIVTIIAVVVHNKNNETDFGKNINANDLELEYTIYTGSDIWVEITPLVDVQDLKVEVCYLQYSNILRQDHEWLELDFLEKGNTYNLHYDLSDSYPFDRVRLYSISGKKRNNCEDFSECKRTGIIKAPSEFLNSNLFTLRLDTTTAHTTSYGTLYVTSSIDLWDVSFQINRFSHLYIPDIVDEMPANQEVAIDMKKMISDTGILDHVSIKSASGRTTADIIINE